MPLPMSRMAAVRAAQGRRIDRQLAERRPVARARSHRRLAEQQPDVTQEGDAGAGVVHAAAVPRNVARMRPIGVGEGRRCAA